MAIIHPEIYTDRVYIECEYIAQDIAENFDGDAQLFLVAAVRDWDIIKGRIIAALPRYADYADELVSYVINERALYLHRDIAEAKAATTALSDDEWDELSAELSAEIEANDGLPGYIRGRFA